MFRIIFFLVLCCLELITLLCLCLWIVNQFSRYLGLYVICLFWMAMILLNLMREYLLLNVLFVMAQIHHPKILYVLFHLLISSTFFSNCEIMLKLCIHFPLIMTINYLLGYPHKILNFSNFFLKLWNFFNPKFHHRFNYLMLKKASFLLYII